MMIPCASEVRLTDTVFRRTDQDKKPRLSVEDQDSLNIIMLSCSSEEEAINLVHRTHGMKKRKTSQIRIK